MKIHFSSELEANLCKASGGCGVCGSTTIVGMLRPMARASCGAAAGAALTCVKLLVLGAPLADGSRCWSLLSPEEMGNALVQAAGESGEEMREPGGVSCQRMGNCVGPKNCLSNKPTHNNKWEWESCQLIKTAHNKKYWG